MPQMNVAFSGWTIKMTWAKITQVIQDGFPVDQEIPYTIDGVFQPMSAEEIQLKPDGQWSWSWHYLHIEGRTSPFSTNDRIKFQGVTYKVMAKKDYKLNNFTELHLILDFQGSPDA